MDIRVNLYRELETVEFENTEKITPGADTRMDLYLSCRCGKKRNNKCSKK